MENFTLYHSKARITYEADKITLSHEKVDHNIWNIIVNLSFDGFDKEFRFFCNDSSLIAQIEALEQSKVGLRVFEQDEIDSEIEDLYFDKLSISEKDEIYDFCDECATWPDEDMDYTIFNPTGHSLIPSRFSPRYLF